MDLSSLAILLFLFDSTLSSLSTEYYEGLIKEKTEKTLQYQLPQGNEEFRGGFESNTATDFGWYDFIIVGSGSAGSVIATRLSEIENFSILLLEAGGEEDDFSQIPSLYSQLISSKMNWGYYTTPQKYSCLGMEGRKCSYPRGKVVGGCTSINAMIYSRGNPKDFDEWEEMGNEGWSYKDILPYFIKSENSQIEGDGGYHGVGGFWNVEHSTPYLNLLATFINGSTELNLPKVDYNGRDGFGSSPPQVNVKRGKRQSTGTAFLDNARKRSNLKLLTNALATKIIINQNKLAEGVEFVTHNRKFLARARKEVIVSGGVVNSPQLLMLSGIGPRDHLEELRIKVVADLPVGKNLLEQIVFSSLLFRTNQTFPNLTLKEQVELFQKGLGPLSSPSTVGLGFAKTEPNSQVPTIEYLLIFPLGNESFDASGYTNISITLVILHPKSKGRITLNSSNPIDFPNIDLNMLAEPEDVEAVIGGIEFVLNLTKTEAFKSVGTELVEIEICQDLKDDFKKYWECVIRSSATPAYHSCGTTAMGQNPSTSVVDKDLKVHGIGRLRVADAGIFPTSLSGHYSAPAVMVGEKISEVIKREHGY